MCFANPSTLLIPNPTSQTVWDRTQLGFVTLWSQPDIHRNLRFGGGSQRLWLGLARFAAPLGYALPMELPRRYGLLELKFLDLKFDDFRKKRLETSP